jgi:hypothetical protein
MTDKELKMIAKTRSRMEPSVFDEAATFWPGQNEWRVQVIQAFANLQQAEEEQIQVEKQCKDDTAAAEHARKAEEKAARKTPKRTALTVSTQASTSTNPPHADFVDESGSFFFPEGSVATPVQPLAVGTIQVGANGLLTPLKLTSGTSCCARKPKVL